MRSGLENSVFHFIYVYSDGSQISSPSPISSSRGIVVLGAFALFTPSNPTLTSPRSSTLWLPSWYGEGAYNSRYSAVLFSASARNRHKRDFISGFIGLVSSFLGELLLVSYILLHYPMSQSLEFVEILRDLRCLLFYLLLCQISPLWVLNHSK
jgi:hypothetical protein